MPRFSIVIPTRNRPQLVQYALQCALAQTFDDYEVILSDNSDGPETRAVYDRFATPRTRYAKTPRMLSMPDSWEFAVGQATGEYVAILCDDDAIVPGLLQRLHDLLERDPADMVSWRRHAYVMGDWFIENQRNHLYVRAKGAGVTRVESETWLRKWFHTCDYHHQAPMLFNGICRRSVIEDCRREWGRFFLSPCPDVGAGLMMLSRIPSYLQINGALALAGVSQMSIGASGAHNNSRALAAFIKEFDGSITRHGPVKTVTLTTGVLETLYEAKRLAPARFAAYVVDWVNYWVGCHRDLLVFARGGADVTREMAEYRRLLADQPAKLRGAVRAALLRKKVRSVRHALRDRVRAAVGRGKDRGRLEVSGAQAGFSNILECAQRLEAITASQWGG
jgi:glycosyltransferase involved in cell wall biosynthesis